MWQTIATILGAAAVVVPAIVGIILQQLRKTDRENIQSLRDLLATRDAQLADKARDLEILTGEHKQLIQVNVKEMVAGWSEHTRAGYFLDNGSLRTMNEELRVRLGRHETV